MCTHTPHAGGRAGTHTCTHAHTQHVGQLAGHGARAVGFGVGMRLVGGNVIATQTHGGPQAQAATTVFLAGIMLGFTCRWEPGFELCDGEIHFDPHQIEGDAFFDEKGFAARAVRAAFSPPNDHFGLWTLLSTPCRIGHLDLRVLILLGVGP